MNYQDINANVIDRWIEEGWEWGIPVSHEIFEKAKNGEWDIFLTTTKFVPHRWLGDVKGKKILGLAAGGGQQMPILTALGGICTVFDYSPKQLESERFVAERENYSIEIVRGDMTKPLPFSNESFDMIIHPVSNCYVKEVKPIFKECFRVLKKGGLFLGGYDNGINYIFDTDEVTLKNSLPFDPLKNPEHLQQLMDEDCGIQFSHTLEEQLGGQLEAGFTLLDLYEDYNAEGALAEKHIPSYFATLCKKL